MEQARRKLARAGVAIALAIAMVLAVPGAALSAGIDPPSAEFTLPAGGSSVLVDVVTPVLPAKVDVLFVFDSSESMGDAIAAARLQAMSIMTQLDALGADTQYGLITHVDYPHLYNYTDGIWRVSKWYGSPNTGDYAYALNHPITGDESAVASSIASITTHYGADPAENYVRPLYEAYADPAVGWRPGAKRILVDFSDNLPHDDNVNAGVLDAAGTLNTGPDPGRDEVLFTADDLDLQTVVTGLQEAGITLVACRTRETIVPQSGLPMSTYWRYWARQTGGDVYFVGTSAMAEQVVAAVTTTLLAPDVEGLHLRPAAAYEQWTAGTSPASYSGPSGVAVPFTVPLHVPEGTPDGTYCFPLEAFDGAGVSYGVQDLVVHVVSNASPSLSADSGALTVTEGSTASMAGTVSDPDGDAVTLSASAGSVVANGDGTWTWSMLAGDGPWTGDVTVTADDGHGGTAATSFSIAVANAAPTLSAFSAPIDPNALATEIVASGSFDDSGSDAHTAILSWGDGTSSEASVDAAGGTFGAAHTYAAAGVYTLGVTVTDDDGAATSGTFSYVVVYDPSAGFVTGGGWITSPAGAYLPSPALSGKATFGFVSKYLQGATVPTGNTEFHFQAAGMRFKSSALDWMVITGPKVVYTGSGTLDGTGGYRFMLTGFDGKLAGGGEPGRLRMRIWDDASGSLVYDNQRGASDTADPVTELGGGSIVIHRD